MSKKIIAVLWPIIAFMMIGYNAYLIKWTNESFNMSLPYLQKLDIRLERLLNIKTIKKEEEKERLKLFNRIYSFIKAMKAQKEKANMFHKEEPIHLPLIQGIIKSIDQRKKIIHRVVMINGRGYKEGEKVNGFVIEKILDNGIYLTKHKKKWFIKIPDVRFSIINE